jgi:hypothetical protein
VIDVLAETQCNNEPKGIYVYPTDELFSKKATIRLYGSHISLYDIFLRALTLFNALLTAAKTTTGK